MYQYKILQEFSPEDYKYNIEERSIDYSHDEYKVITQATCTGTAIGDNGWTSGGLVRRLNHPMLKSCIEVCTA